VQIGTAYLFCPEATIRPVHREALKRARENETALTNVFTGRPARGIMNRAVREVGPMSEVAPEFPLAATALAPLRSKAEAAGSGDFTPLWAGQGFPQWDGKCRQVTLRASSPKKHWLDYEVTGRRYVMTPHFIVRAEVADPSDREPFDRVMADGAETTTKSIRRRNRSSRITSPASMVFPRPTSSAISRLTWGSRSALRNGRSW
jgi:hypothetical protein